MTEQDRTHWEDCWRYHSHHACCVARAVRLEAELEECQEALQDAQIRLGTREGETYVGLRKQIEGLTGAVDSYEAELQKCRNAHSRVVDHIEAGGEWVESARRVAMWHSVPGHPDDESSGPDASLHQQLDDCREALNTQATARMETEQQLDDCQGKLDQEAWEWQRANEEVKQLREELAAAQAREEELFKILDELHTLLDFEVEVSLYDALAPANPTRINKVFRKAYEATHREQPNHAALDAYVEERTTELQERLAAACELTNIREGQLRDELKAARETRHKLAAAQARQQEATMRLAAMRAHMDYEAKTLRRATAAPQATFPEWQAIVNVVVTNLERAMQVDRTALNAALEQRERLVLEALCQLFTGEEWDQIAVHWDESGPEPIGVNALWSTVSTRHRAALEQAREAGYADGYEDGRNQALDEMKA